MLTTSDPDRTRQAFDALNLPFQEHGAESDDMDAMTIAGMRGR
jgi:hypothetical protein